MDPASRARLSLQGLSLGDAFGERFFTTPDVEERRIRARELPPGPWTWTDDTAMALCIVESLEACGGIDEAHLAARFVLRYLREPARGYGAGARRALQLMASGVTWLEASRSLFDGQGSLGNGAAMRVAPLGAFFAGDLPRLVDEARRSAIVTHAHPEAQDGAVAVAAAAAHACSAGARAGAAVLDAAVDATPEGRVRAALVAARDFPLPAEPEAAASVLGSGGRIHAVDTVPFALWCAARHLDDFAEAMWTTVRGGGDRDTTCAIAGGIVALAVGESGLPGAWLARREPLPALSPR